MLFFFKQKTAYEMRISDWSSDVCSSDLQVLLQKALLPLRAPFDMLAMKLRYYFKPLEVQALGRELQWHLGLASWPVAPGPIHPQSGTTRRSACCRLRRAVTAASAVMERKTKGV